MRLWLIAAGAVLIALVAGGALWAARPTAVAEPPPAVPSASAPTSSTPSPARLDMPATCAAAVPALLTATELLQAFADTNGETKALRALDAERYRTSAASLAAIVAAAAPAVEPLLKVTATAMGGISRVLRSGGSLETDWDAIRAANTGIAEACRPYATG